MKLIGYLVSLIGIVCLAVSSGKFNLPFIAGIGTKYFVIAGLILVILGVFFVMQDSNNVPIDRQAKEEVPIYEGEGKNRRIVGYRKEVYKK